MQKSKASIKKIYDKFNFFTNSHNTQIYILSLLSQIIHQHKKIRNRYYQKN